MSGLRDSLGGWSAARGDEVAAGLRTTEPQTRAAIRRRRTRHLTLTTGVAVVGLVAASALMVAGPWRAAQPAAPTIEGEPLDLSALTCGTPWTLEQGTITHDESAPAYFGGLAGGWVMHTDYGEVVENPDSVYAGYEVLAWQGTPAVNGTVVVQGVVVVVEDGVIIGSVAPEVLAGSSSASDSVTVYGALPGSCAGAVVPRESGDYTYHAVLTAILVGDTYRPLQTIVDPTGPITVNVHSLEYWADGSATGTTAELREPQGDVYQAFVVAPPAPGSCVPYTGLIEAGAPDANALQYEVTIPGVQPLTGEIWGNQPAAIIEDENYDAWYVGLATGITAQQVDGGNPLGNLEWTTGPAVGEESHEGELRLVNTWEATAPGPIADGCAFTQPIPALSGAVFLIIDGIDGMGLDAAYPGADLVLPEGAQTWVYLGQAD